MIGVKLEHFSGARETGPHFELKREDVSVVTRNTDDEASLTSGTLTVRIAKTGDWAVDFLRDGRRITGSTLRACGQVKDANQQGADVYVRASGPRRRRVCLRPGRTLYGVREERAGRRDLERDGGTGSDQAYKNVPFYLTNRGYGVFVNHPENVSFEVASEKVSRVQFSVAGRSAGVLRDLRPDA